MSDSDNLEKVKRRVLDQVIAYKKGQFTARQRKASKDLRAFKDTWTSKYQNRIRTPGDDVERVGKAFAELERAVASLKLAFDGNDSADAWKLYVSGRYTLPETIAKRLDDAKCEDHMTWFGPKQTH